MSDSQNSLQTVIDYHAASKHRLNAYAPGPGSLDWASQPEPFRYYDGVRRIELPLFNCATDPTFRAVRRGAVDIVQRKQGLEPLAALLELSLGLSAWKEYGASRWALRCNPSSGNLHPTECYVVTAGDATLAGGVYHYLSHAHCLEQRAGAAPVWAPQLRGGYVLILSSIHWREAWKYGLRAYRYCQHDCGHAMAAISYAAASLGWRVQVLTGWSDETLAALSGLARREDFCAGEEEYADVALWVGPDEMPSAVREDANAAAWARDLQLSGRANRLSAEHVDWTGIEQVHAAARRPALSRADIPDAGYCWPQLLDVDCGQSAATLIRQRRSAVQFDAVTTISAAQCFTMLDALLVRRTAPPWTLAWQEAFIHPALFIHRVRDLTPGVYMLVRDPDRLPSLQKAMRPDAQWQRVEAAPAHLPLYRLFAADARDAAQWISCHQEIAADGCFAVAMLADFAAGLQGGPWVYRELFWEAGMLGQALYLEAEAAGIRGTGIGCYFDDVVHEMLGLSGQAWQSLYHFTVGGPVADTRLRTVPPYAHLHNRK